MRSLANLTDEQIECAFDDQCYIDDIVFTKDSIEDFARARSSWACIGKIKKQTAEELVIDGVQVSKGETRRQLHVLDFGEVRGAVFL